MTTFRGSFTALLTLIGACQCSMAQTQLATGAQPFGSFTPTSFETFDNGNLNMHFEIPIVARSGRGMPFSYSLAYDSSIWSPTSSSGTGTWTPQATWGWSAVTQASLGYISFAFSPGSAACGPQERLRPIGQWRSPSFIMTRSERATPSTERSLTTPTPTGRAERRIAALVTPRRSARKPRMDLDIN